MSGQKILVVDDESGARQLVATHLDRDGFRVVEALSGAEALEILRTDDPCLLILDVSLPKVDGFSVLREVRRHSDLPVILLTARADEADRILGLELGADDYVLKPFSPRELVARVRNVLKRTGAPAAKDGPARCDFGDLVVDPGTREVVVSGEPVELRPKEFDLLRYLCENPRQVFSREQLLGQVWDSTPEWQDTATVTVHVRRLRKKIESDPSSPRWIQTVWGVGYRFEPGTEVSRPASSRRGPSGNRPASGSSRRR